MGTRYTNDVSCTDANGINAVTQKVGIHFLHVRAVCTRLLLSRPPKSLASTTGVLPDSTPPGGSGESIILAESTEFCLTIITPPTQEENIMNKNSAASTHAALHTE